MTWHCLPLQWGERISQPVEVTCFGQWTLVDLVKSIGLKLGWVFDLAA